MKNLVIIIGTILLGCIIFRMMVGPQPESLKSVTGEVMKQILYRYGN